MRPYPWRWSLIGLPLCALAQGSAAQTASAQFQLRMTLLPPPGCTGSTGVGAQAGTPQVTLTCGANLLVNVRPVLLSLDAGPFRAPAPADAAITTGGSPPGGGVRFGPESGFEGGAPQVIDGVLFLYVVAPAAGSDSAGDGRFWRSAQTVLMAQAVAGLPAPGKAIEMWLSF